MYLFCSCCPYFIRRGIEVRRDKNLLPIDEEDVDVARERQRVMLGGNSDDVLKIEELTKVSHFALDFFQYFNH